MTKIKPKISKADKEKIRKVQELTDSLNAEIDHYVNGEYYHIKPSKSS